MSQVPNTFFTFLMQPCGPNTFVDFWRQQFVYPSMDAYEKLILQRPITEDQLRGLFTWKNGMNLSGPKKTSVEDNMISKFSVIQDLTESFDREQFDLHFGKLRVVWRVFLLHIIDREQFPIFDQHVHRAFRHLTNGDDKKLSEGSLTIQDYEQYSTFYKALCSQYTGSRVKNVDEALWSFGKFLTRYPEMI